MTISFVIPVYNEEKRIRKTFKALEELQFPRGLKLDEIIFVDDGSTDNSKCKIQNAKLHNLYKIKLISYKKNRGKGYAVRQGMLISQADYTLLFDADMSTPLSELTKFAPFMKKNIDVIVGTRRDGESTVIKHQPLFREVLGRIYTAITRKALGLSVTDLTCGFKAFSQKAGFMIFSKSRVHGWGYDAEVLFIAIKQNLTIAEKAVVWLHEEHSKVKLYKAIPQTLFDLLYIRLEHEFYPALREFAKTIFVRYGKHVPSV